MTKKRFSLSANSERGRDIGVRISLKSERVDEKAV
jgi:hypothetical protein